MTHTSLTGLLREQTKAEHALLEKKLVLRIKKINSVAQYQDLLALFYGYYRTLETALQPWLTADRIPDTAERRKSASLLQDIRELGGEIPALPPAVIPAINSYPEALGAAYVLEGSTLGGMVIAKMISQQVRDLPEGKGFAFFACYGNKTAEMWNIFRNYLDGIHSVTEQQEALEAARNTFLTFSDWVEQYEPVF
ncbi:MAG: biliverdin-producing heme oxygenase [Candidatus Pseudobacter hemicellulosilyticus]|uniref:Biliverdin-producing heme oxygenase n=1 Tax=Candidatus Pseudobacter hemicellulosilyticus TaxID=3121375 RepID=A0AAJ6BFS8_9BACT|nr:MAG: biliverdin-producing heme oxygenase [Pseudobacter sp.]